MTTYAVASRPFARIDVAGLGRVAVLMLSGAAPVSAIALFVLDWVSLEDAALFGVLPLAVIASALIVRRSPQAAWAVRGFVAGLGAVAAYDAVRLPLVWTNVWPDFIPRLGGWVTGEDGKDAVVGYAYRWLGDGGGIGLAYFVFVGFVLSIRPTLVTARPLLLSVGYGVFVWTGLMATVTLPARGEQLLFQITPASVALSLLGHLVYGSVLGLFLCAHLRRRRQGQDAAGTDRARGSGCSYALSPS